MNVLEEFAPHAYWKFSLSGVDLSINQYVLWMLISAALVFLFFFFASRRPQLVPSGAQNVAEVLLDFVRNSIVLEIMGEAGLPYLPFIATIFLFVLASNFVGLIPHTGAATGRIGTTLTWALIVFTAYNLIGIKKQGLWRYAKGIVPSGVPAWMLVLMLPIEIIGHVARPISLAIRLFANILAGHMVLAVFTMMAMTSIWWIKWLPFGGVLIMDMFEIFVAAIQAYIFSVLTAIYINGAIHAEH